MQAEQATIFLMSAKIEIIIGDNVNSRASLVDQW